MAVDNKTAAADPSLEAQLEAETQDEIAEIMNEIKDLQQNMAKVSTTSESDPILEGDATPAIEKDPADDISGIENFHGAAGEASMEETLAGIEEEETSGPSLLDVAPTDEELAAEAVSNEPIAPNAPSAEEELVAVLNEAAALENADAVAMGSTAEMDQSLDSGMMASMPSNDQDEIAALAKQTQTQAARVRSRPKAVLAAVPSEPLAPPMSMSSAGDLSELNEAPSQPAQALNAEAAEKEIMKELDFDTTAAGEASEGALTMTLQGNMKLKLKYEYEGQEVTIRFVDQALQVQLSDGTEFKIPVARGRKAA